MRPLTSRWLTHWSIGLLTALAASHASAQPRHLILITVDTLRADRLGAYGYTEARTPAIDALAGESLRFERAYAHSSITFPSVASLLTGMLPAQHGISTNSGMLRRTIPTIAVDFDPRPRWDEIERGHHRWSKIARTLSKDLPAESCLASGWGFHYGLYMDRPVYSMVPMVRHVGEASGAEWVIDRYGVDTVVLSPRRDADKLLLPYFEEHYGPGRTVAALRSFRVRPPAAGCRHREGS